MRGVNIEGREVSLRALEPEDLDLIYMWENDMTAWDHSETRVPYSRHQLREFIESQRQDVGVEGQSRFMICRDDLSIGMVDIFEHDPYNHRAGVGIFIDPAYRSKGYALDALLTLEGYLTVVFELRQLWCNISIDNIASIELFQKCGYRESGAKKQWRRRGAIYVDELFFQKIFNK
ncbi:MAG: GNAT family N-acetyltransferase [Rikenellaceae bacterium]